MLKWEAPLEAIRDGRKRPQIETRRIVRSAVVMFLCRLGSLNALGQSKGSRFWRSWLGAALPSPDTVGRVAGLIDPEQVRALHRALYAELKRGKALAPPQHGLMAAILDGHESHATYRRRCSGCLERKVRTAKGDRVQYYHRYVALRLVGKDMQLMLDMEEQRPGEDEVASALRLLERVLRDYPRAFQVVLADSLYADPRVFNLLKARGKEVQTTLKDDLPAFLEDALAVARLTEPVQIERDGRKCLCWDIEGFRTWTSVKEPLRVVRSLETEVVRRQVTRQREEVEHQWVWVTTLKATQAGTAAVMELGHARWQIENQGFNEMVNRWHTDHVYRHEPVAMLVMMLLGMACLNVFVAFWRRNLKPAARQALSMLHVSRQILAELYAGIAGTTDYEPAPMQGDAARAPT